MGLGAVRHQSLCGHFHCGSTDARHGELIHTRWLAGNHGIDFASFQDLAQASPDQELLSHRPRDQDRPGDIGPVDKGGRAKAGGKPALHVNGAPSPYLAFEDLASVWLMLPKFGHTDRHNIHMSVEDDRRSGLGAVDGSDHVSPPINLNRIVFQFLHLSGNGSGCFRLISREARTSDQFLSEAEDFLLPIFCQFHADVNSPSLDRRAHPRFLAGEYAPPRLQAQPV